MIAGLRRQMRRPKPRWVDINEEKKEPETVFRKGFDLSKATDAEILADYRAQMVLIRKLILFHERIPDGKVDYKDLVERQEYVRKQLGLTNPATFEANLKNSFKIIDVIQKQTLFVYDPEFECYDVLTGEKKPSFSKEPGVFSYFNTSGRECVH